MKLGIIGFGNMAEAILAGILAKGFIRVQDVIVSRRSKDKLEETASKYGVAVTTDNKKVAKEADVIILGVKPQMNLEGKLQVYHH